MAFCPRCGAQTTPGTMYCSACGASLAQDAAPAAPASTTAAAPGPVGATREPAIAVVLAIVTLGIYSLYYWWVTSREVDAYVGKPGHSHQLVRIGTILLLVGGVGLFFVFVSFLGGMMSTALSGQDPTEEEILAIVFGSMGFFLLFGLAAFAGTVVRLVGKWRLWSALEADERRRHHATPLSAGLMLALVVIGWFISPFGWILTLIVLYMTQDHLNQAWSASR